MATFQMGVYAAINGWQGAPVSLAHGETAVVTATGKWGVIDPAVRGDCGPGGNGVQSHGTFYGAVIAAPEGCLLMSDGYGQIFAWRSDSDAIKVAIPGLLSFIANDDPTPPKGYGFQGFGDNSGAIVVTIEVVRTDV